MSMELAALSLIVVLLALLGARQKILHADLREILKELQDEKYRAVMTKRMAP